MKFNSFYFSLFFHFHVHQNIINPAALLNLINVENLKEKSLEIKKMIEKSINEI